MQTYLHKTCICLIVNLSFINGSLAQTPMTKFSFDGNEGCTITSTEIYCTPQPSDGVITIGTGKGGIVDNRKVDTNMQKHTFKFIDNETTSNNNNLIFNKNKIIHDNDKILKNQITTH